MPCTRYGYNTASRGRPCHVCNWYGRKRSLYTCANIASHDAVTWAITKNSDLTALRDIGEITGRLCPCYRTIPGLLDSWPMRLRGMSKTETSTTAIRSVA